MTGHTLELTAQEISLGWTVGAQRALRSMLRPSGRGRDYQRDPGRHADELSLMANVVGAWGEIACARVIGRYWPATVDAVKGDPDIPPDIQVRTAAQHGDRLIVRTRDDERQRYVLVTGIPPAPLCVVGWIWGHEGKRDDWRHDIDGRGVAWWIPQSALHPLRIPQRQDADS